MVSEKRRNAIAEASTTMARNRLAYPRRQMASITSAPSRRRILAISAMLFRQQFRPIGGRRIVERHRAVGFAIDELVHIRDGGVTHFVGRPVCDHSPLRYKINVV